MGYSTLGCSIALLLVAKMILFLTALLFKWLCRYVIETRREDGTHLPSTLPSLSQSNNATSSILDKHDPQFRDLIKTVSSGLHKLVLPCTKHSMKIYGRRAYLDRLHPRYSNTLSFFTLAWTLWAASPSQLVRVPDVAVYDKSVYYQYTEFISENNQHRFKSTNKSVHTCAQPGSSRWIVQLLDTYMALLPPGSPVFYLRAPNGFPSELNKSCFVSQSWSQFAQKYLSGVWLWCRIHIPLPKSNSDHTHVGVPEKVITLGTTVWKQTQLHHTILLPIRFN